jgi:hypothetical protein
MASSTGDHPTDIAPRAWLDARRAGGAAPGSYQQLSDVGLRIAARSSNDSGPCQSPRRSPHERNGTAAIEKARRKSWTFICRRCKGQSETGDCKPASRRVPSLVNHVDQRHVRQPLDSWRITSIAGCLRGRRARHLYHRFRSTTTNSCEAFNSACDSRRQLSPLVWALPAKRSCISGNRESGLLQRCSGYESCNSLAPPN